jgi:hypothetical protein
MKVGDLVKISPKDGGASSIFGIFLGTKRDNDYNHWATFYINDKKKNFFLFDYSFEVINESRRLDKV